MVQIAATGKIHDWLAVPPRDDLWVGFRQPPYRRKIPALSAPVRLSQINGRTRNTVTVRSQFLVCFFSNLVSGQRHRTEQQSHGKSSNHSAGPFVQTLLVVKGRLS
jgi:hypothetical protein